MYPLVITIGLLDRVIITRRVFIKSVESIGQSISYMALPILVLYVFENKLINVKFSYK